MLAKNNQINTVKDELIINGISGSPGISSGKLLVIKWHKIPVKKENLHAAEIDTEVRRFRDAITDAITEITRLKRDMIKRIGSDVADILEVQIMILSDEEMNRRIVSRIREEKVNAEFAYDNEIRTVTESLKKSTNEYFRQRLFDINGIRAKVLTNLRGLRHQTLVSIKEPSIVAAKALSAGEIAQIAGSNVVGIVTREGGVTSHTALLAKSLNIPAVLGIEDDFERLEGEPHAIIDGYQGKLIINPTEDTIERYNERYLNYAREQEQLLVARDEPAATLDGHRVNLLANIELVSEIDMALSVGAEGIGLYRSEFMYFTHGGLPSEEQQFKVYRKIVEKISPRPVTIRTFDLGGDKFIEDSLRTFEVNPFLGWRAIRISLTLRDYFKSQLRAILRASAYGDVSIMLPMICNIDEVCESKEIFEQVKKELKDEGIAFNPETRFGIMIEIPSAAINAISIAKYVDFFSIGTNDLTQYTLAVDRGNEIVSKLFESFDPAVIKLTAMAIKGARDAGIPVSVCGEMAGDPLATVLLVGLGASALSAPYSTLPQIKNIIRNIFYRDAQDIAKKALDAESTGQLKNLLANYLTEHFEGSSCPI
ncbi:MAG: phosphoenolpyruvate--protein phosphotransferase [candidate division Zixibacteria bacterium]|nr:phosphoenolpyruvate--protein phosphotransferase [candidate division Zixibacteria bacterium]